MARKPNPTAARAKSSEIATPERPWLKSYPEGIDWNAKFEPGLVGSLLDDAVGAYGSRPCTYFRGKRLSFADMGQTVAVGGKARVVQHLGAAHGSECAHGDRLGRFNPARPK